MKYEKGNFSTVYVYGPTGRLSESTSYEGLDSGKATEKLYYHNDKLGSMIYLTDKNGEVKIQASYNIWGLPNTDVDLEKDTDSITGKEKFTSYTYDDILELYFAQFRFYDPVNMRFTQEDPIKDGVNWYGYVAGNPVNFVDPLGLQLSDLTNDFNDLTNDFNDLAYVFGRDPLREAIDTSMSNKATNTKKSHILKNPMFYIGFAERFGTGILDNIDDVGILPQNNTLGKSIASSYKHFSDLNREREKLKYLRDQGLVTDEEIREYFRNANPVFENIIYMILNGLVGDITYIYEHRHYFKPGFCVTGEEAREFGRRLFGAMEQLLQLGVLAVEIVQAVKGLVGKISAKRAAKGNRSYKEVNIHGKINSELDEVDLVNNIIYEDKNASKLYMDNPDFPQTETQWAEKQIFKKGANRIKALQQDDFKLSSAESSTLPSVAELKNIKTYIFRINADTPALRAAVQIEIEKLLKLYPDYNISATFGGN